MFDLNLEQRFVGQTLHDVGCPPRVRHDAQLYGVICRELGRSSSRWSCFRHQARDSRHRCRSGLVLGFLLWAEQSFLRSHHANLQDAMVHTRKGLGSELSNDSSKSGWGTCSDESKTMKSENEDILLQFTKQTRSCARC